MERSRAWRLVTLLLAAHLTALTAALPEVIKLGRSILSLPDLINIVYVEKELRETEINKDIAYCADHLCIVDIFRVHVKIEHALIKQRFIPYRVGTTAISTIL
jgi:hypothetical protein